MSSEAVIGLIAVQGEAAPLLNLLTVTARTRRLQARFHQGSLAHRTVVLAEIGPGKIQAAAATQSLIERYQAKLVLSCGSAGAINPRLKLGDIILADHVVPHDTGQQLNSGFRYLGIYDNTRPSGFHYHHHLAANQALLARARQAAETISWPQPSPLTRIGCLASGDQIIASDRKRRWLLEKFQALAVDMESGAVAQVAFLNDIPWLAIRSISDRADSDIDIDLTELISYVDEMAPSTQQLHQTARRLAQYFKRPQQLKRLWQIRQDIERAAHSAAQVTAAIVTQLGPE